MLSWRSMVVSPSLEEGRLKETMPLDDTQPETAIVIARRDNDLSRVFTIKLHCSLDRRQCRFEGVDRTESESSESSSESSTDSAAAAIGSLSTTSNGSANIRPSSLRSSNALSKRGGDNDPLVGILNAHRCE